MDLIRKTNFFEVWSWFKINNLRLEQGMILKFYSSVEIKLNVKINFQKVLKDYSYV